MTPEYETQLARLSGLGSWQEFEIALPLCEGVLARLQGQPVHEGTNQILDEAWYVVRTYLQLTPGTMTTTELESANLDMEEKYMTYLSPELGNRSIASWAMNQPNQLSELQIEAVRCLSDLFVTIGYELLVLSPHATRPDYWGGEIGMTPDDVMPAREVLSFLEEAGVSAISVQAFLDQVLVLSSPMQRGSVTPHGSLLG